MNERLSRRAFLASSLGGFALTACGRKSPAGSQPWTGGIVGASHAFGHLLRQAANGSSAAVEKADVLVVGGGMAGLIAAFRLKQAGRNVLVIELNVV